MAAIACVLAAGCSATLKDRPPDPAVVQRLAEVRAIAGPPVDSFWYEPVSSFEPIGDANLLIFTSPRHAWLLQLDGSCRELDFDPFIAVTSQMNRVTARFDSVRVRHNPIPCQIMEIRPVDAAVLRRVDREKKAQPLPPDGGAAKAQ
ncbi:MAG TPA: DUF6491 family protein [Xanthomonadaceae bacterium]